MGSEIQDLRDEMNRRFEAITDEMNRRFEAITDEMNRRFEGIAELFTQVIQRLEEQVNSRLDGVDRRLDRIENRLTAVEFQFAGLHRWMDQVDRATPQTLATQAAQQKAIDSLAERVTRLEQERRRQ